MYYCTGINLTHHFWTDSCRQKADLIKAAKQHWGSVHVAESDVPHPYYNFTKIVDSGLLILSRFPLQKLSEITFKSSSGWDALSHKGAVLVRVVIDSTSIHIINTHLNAGGNWRVRKSQVNELETLVQYYHSCCLETQEEPPAGAILKDELKLT